MNQLYFYGQWLLFSCIFLCYQTRTISSKPIISLIAPTPISMYPLMSTFFQFNSQNNNKNKEKISYITVPNSISSAAALYFKQKDEISPDKLDKNNLWQTVTKFFSPMNKAKLEKSYNTPSPNTHLHYHLRLKDHTSSPHHIITRIIRLFPDISYDHAKEIVSRARESGKSLIRVCRSLTEATEAVDLLRRADPPVACEIYDEKSDEIVPY